MNKQCYPFEMVSLSYSLDALEPYIDSRTMDVHYNRLYKNYVNKLNAALEPFPCLQGITLEQLLQCRKALPEKQEVEILRSAGGTFNHGFYFKGMRPAHKGNMPQGSLAKAIARCFGSFETFQKLFTQKAMEVFGSGYLWLTRDYKGDLDLVTTCNQVTPLAFGHIPILTIDVWEHAYFLQRENHRDAYIAAWWNLVDWQRAEALYAPGAVLENTQKG